MFLYRHAVHVDRKKVGTVGRQIGWAEALAESLGWNQSRGWAETKADRLGWSYSRHAGLMGEQIGLADGMSERPG